MARITAAIKAKLDADTALTALLITLPDDSRTSAVYRAPLTRSGTPETFMDAGADTPYPSISLWEGRGPVDHPQTGRLAYLQATYPTVSVYAPVLPGVDGFDTVSRVIWLLRGSLHEWAGVDPETGKRFTLMAFGALGPRYAVDYPDTAFDQLTFQARLIWKEG